MMHPFSRELIYFLDSLSLLAPTCAIISSWLSYYGNKTISWALHLLTVAWVTGEEK